MYFKPQKQIPNIPQYLQYMPYGLYLPSIQLKVLLSYSEVH